METGNLCQNKRRKMCPEGMAVPSSSLVAREIEPWFILLDANCMEQSLFGQERTLVPEGLAWFGQNRQVSTRDKLSEEGGDSWKWLSNSGIGNPFGAYTRLGFRKPCLMPSMTNKMKIDFGWLYNFFPLMQCGHQWDISKEFL